ncbi:MAG TPA: DUF1844 domain-containing protein [Actinomycetota bacterium]|jgi:hypothetical protein|nr:DUF1844 domain-containing protein [Actinomycetota bacterium]
MSESNHPQHQAEQADQAAEAEAMRRLHEELASSPVGDVVAQAAAHLATFAYVRLGIPPEENQRFRDLDAARVLIDALGGLLGAVRGRLGQGEGALQEALAALRMTYASAASQQGRAAAGAEPEPPRPAPREEPGLHRPSGLWVPGQD